MRRRDFFKRTQRKRYVRGDYQNPYFQDKQQISWKHLFAIGAGVVGVIVITVLFLSHPRFVIRSVAVKGIVHIDENEFESIIREYLGSRKVLFFKKTNRFIFTPDPLQELLEESFAFENILVNQKGTEIVINLKERTSHLIWKTYNTFYLVDLNGVVSRELTNEELNLLKEDIEDKALTTLPFIRSLPVIVDRNNIEITIGSEVLTPVEIENAFRFHKHLSAQNISFISTEIDRLAGKWSGVVTKEGYRILFDLSADIDEQAERLETILKEREEDKVIEEYVDLRFGDHVYIK